MAAPVIIVLGPPWSGKGTQSEILAQQINGIHLSSGQMMRDSTNQDMQDRVATGRLAKNEDFFLIVKDAIEKTDPDFPIVLDGVGRMIAEVRWLMKTLHEFDRPIQRVILLLVPDSVSKERFMKRAETSLRRDDAEKATKTRLRLYKDKTLPGVDIYGQQGLLTEVDGTGTVEEVAERIKKVLQ